MPAASTAAPSLQRTVAKTAPRTRGRRRNRWIKRGLLIAGGLAIIAALVYAWLPKPVPVDIAGVRRGRFEVSVTDDGRTRVRDRYVVSAPVAGNLLRIDLDPGADVDVGTIVARIAPPDPVSLDARTRATTEAQLAAALAQLRQAEQAIARARVAKAAATREARRTGELARGGAVAMSELDKAKDAENIAAVDLAQAEMSRNVASAEVAAARAALGRGTQDSSGTIPVTAPARGKVLRVVRDSAGPVAAGTPLLEVGDPREIEVVVDVLSSDAARINVGARAVIEDWGGDRGLAGRVRMIEPSAFTHVSALGIEEQRVNVILAVDEPPPTLADGFRVEARIVIWRGEDVLTIPASAVFRDRNRWSVYAVEDGRAQLRAIEIGHRGPTEVEVIRGLRDGDTVIIHPGDRISDGVRVKPR